MNGSCECVTQDEAGQERPEHEAACTIFSPVHFSKLFPTTLQPLFTKSTFQPLTLLPSACQCQSGGVVGGKIGWRQGSAFLLVAGSGGGTSAKVGKETTTVSVRWQLLLTLGIGLASSCSRLLHLAPTSPMESRALAFRQGRALSAHYSRCSCCWWPGKGWTDVGRDLGSNKSPRPQ